jgi:NAD(P)H-flavin reductase
MAFLGTKNISVFLCGKPEMVDQVKALLLEK